VVGEYLKNTTWRAEPSSLRRNLKKNIRRGLTVHAIRKIKSKDIPYMPD
jgi:hypothetical protein